MAEEDPDDQYRAWQRVHRFLRLRVASAKLAYNQALTSLWIGNGAAALATLSFIGATWHQGDIRGLLWPLGFFLAGLISMGVGAMGALITERRTIARNQDANSLLDIKADDVKSPVEDAGLVFWNWRTAMGIISGLFFVSGCAVGYVELWVSAP